MLPAEIYKLQNCYSLFNSELITIICILIELTNVRECKLRLSEFDETVVQQFIKSICLYLLLALTVINKYEYSDICCNSCAVRSLSVQKTLMSSSFCS